MLGIGSSPIQKLAISAIQANSLGNRLREISMKAEPGDNSQEVEVEKQDAEAKEKLKEDLSNMDSESKAKVEKLEEAVKLRAQDMPGVSAPAGFFDPLGFTTDCSVGKLLFYPD